jgi:hypothetical protein
MGNRLLGVEAGIDAALSTGRGHIDWFGTAVQP